MQEGEQSRGTTSVRCRGQPQARITGDTVTAYKGKIPFGVQLASVFGRRCLRLAPTDGSLCAPFLRTLLGHSLYRLLL